MKEHYKHRKVAQCVDSYNKTWLKGTAMRLKAQGICGHFNLGQEIIKPFSTSARWLRFPKGNTVWKTQIRQSRQILQLMELGLPLYYVSKLYKRRYCLACISIGAQFTIYKVRVYCGIIGAAFLVSKESVEHKQDFNLLK